MLSIIYYCYCVDADWQFWSTEEWEDACYMEAVIGIGNSTFSSSLFDACDA